MSNGSLDPYSYQGVTNGKTYSNLSTDIKLPNHSLDKNNRVTRCAKVMTAVKSWSSNHSLLTLKQYNIIMLSGSRGFGEMIERQTVLTFLL